MKKVYLALCLSGLMVGAIAQGNIKDAKPLPLQLLLGKVTTAPAQAVMKSSGDVLWQDNFDSISHWTIDNSGASAGWSIVNNSTVQGWTTFVGNGMNSTSGGNFAELYNGNPTNNNPAPVSDTFNLTTANPINLSMAGVDLLIEQEGALFLDNQDILVSIDGTTFVKIGDNSDEPSLTQTNPGVQYAEPYTKKWDLGAALNAAGFTSGNIWIRFQWSPGGRNTTYGWLIDDVRIVEKESNDLSLDAVSWYHNTSSKARYSRVPTSQLASMTFEGNITNRGASTQTNTVLDVAISGTGTGSFVSAPISMVVSEVSQLEASSFTPSSTGSYTASFSVSSDSTDIDASNNAASLSWEVTDYLYGKSGNVMTGWYGNLDDDSDGLNDNFEAITEYELNGPITVYGLKAVFGGGSTDGGEVYYNIYTLDAQGNFESYYDGSSQPRPIRTVGSSEFTSSTNAANWVDLRFPSGISFDPATLNSPVIYAVVGWETDMMEIGVSGEQNDSTTYVNIFQSAGGSQRLYLTRSTWMIDLSENPVSIEEQEALDVSLGQSMPNPSNGLSTIPFTMVNAGNVTFTVTDLTGKMIETRNLGHRAAGEHSIEFDGRNISNGIYYYSLEVNGQRSTKKLTISK